MNPSVTPNVDEPHDRRLKTASEENKTPAERKLPNQVVDRTKRHVESPEVPRSDEK
jgi:hypothetical protein